VTARRIYLDYNASTPIDPAVAAAMRPFLDGRYGNPSSGHWASIEAKAALEKARGQVAASLQCADDEIVFTSGGSEANNLALKGVFFALRDKGDHIITTAIEHPAIVEPCRFLERLSALVNQTIHLDRLPSLFDKGAHSRRRGLNELFFQGQRLSFRLVHRETWFQTREEHRRIAGALHSHGMVPRERPERLDLRCEFFQRSRRHADDFIFLRIEL